VVDVATDGDMCRTRGQAGGKASSLILQLFLVAASIPPAHVLGLSLSRMISPDAAILVTPEQLHMKYFDDIKLVSVAMKQVLGK
jgi:hypothetical protein